MVEPDASEGTDHDVFDEKSLLEGLCRDEAASAESFCRNCYPTAERSVASAGVPAHAVAEVANKALLQVVEKCREGVVRSNLRGFLWKHSRKRALDWLRSEQRKSARESSLEERTDVPEAAIAKSGGMARSDMAKHRRAVRHAQQVAAREEATGLICLRLHLLHGVEYKALSRMWGHGPESWAFRRAQRAGKIIREALLRWHEEQADPLGEEELYEALSEACRESARALSTEIGAGRVRRKKQACRANRSGQQRLFCIATRTIPR